MLSPVLYTSRARRPGERDGKDYHFRGRAAIERLREEERFLVAEVRQDLWAVDLRELEELLASNDVLYEGSVPVARALSRADGFGHVERVGIFVSPLSLEEMRRLRESGVDERASVTELMRRRLMRRAQKQKPSLGLLDLEDVEARAGSAFDDLLHAHEFEYVIPNHDGEDSDHWSLLPSPIGDARKSVQALAALLSGEQHPLLETWPREPLSIPELA